MRDIFFLGILPLMLYAMTRRPFIALGMWIWTAMFFPNAWLYGFGNAIRYNVIFTAVAIGGYLMTKDKPKAVFGSLGMLIFLFFAWTTLSTIMTEGAPEVAWEYWFRFLKIVLLFLFVVLIIDKKLHIDFFLWCVVMSIGFFGGLEALKYIASGGGHHIEGFAGHVLGDRNELSLAFVITLPICFYLLQQYGAKGIVIRVGLLGLMGLLVTAIVGTQSRGGFVALIGLGAYFFVKSDRKILLAIMVCILVAGLSTMVSQEWVSRMDTIGEAKEDASFMGRVVAWKLSFIMAAHHPFLGGGFKALENRAVWAELAQHFFDFSFFYSGDALPNVNLPRAAHSVYFQVLGDHGFVGLALYLSFLARAFITARKVTRTARKHPATAWIANLATMLQLSLFTFCLGGAALSFAYFELIYAICGIILVLDTRILPRALKLAAVAESAKEPALAAARA
ncbi:putative O-glycosylation ligase, exosortase A system-associated [Massilia sp. TSP1-1-2]|uniref:putative O-glycosylation ligase, exosortase A system-associated n=1 Tax=unclassified Massilia TaxID=2609279 RepID=UPI003CEAD8C8